jgi:hypothetical protein
MLARQVLYLLGHSTSPIFIFWNANGARMVVIFHIKTSRIGLGL